MPSHRDIPGLLYDPQFESLLAANSWQVHPSGYVQTVNREFGRVFGRKLHRLIWQAAHGDCPRILDHINGNRLDNRLCNLRAATASLNSRNRQSGGVRRKDGMWDASITVDFRGYHLGRFPTQEEATRYYAYVKDCLIAHEAVLAAGGDPGELRFFSIVRNGSSAETAEAVRRLAPDHSIDQIAQKLGIGYAYAGRLLRQMGLKAPRKERNRRYPKRVPGVPYADVLKEAGLYEQWRSERREKTPGGVTVDSSDLQIRALAPTHTIGEIADFLGVSYQVAAKRLRVLGVQAKRAPKTVPVVRPGWSGALERRRETRREWVERMKEEGRYEEWCVRRNAYQKEYQRKYREQKRQAGRAERAASVVAFVQQVQQSDSGSGVLPEVPGVQEGAAVEITLEDLFG